MPKQLLLKKHFVKVGTIETHGSETIPDDYLVCDGRILNAADYPDLYTVIGTSWGYGYNDGASFHLPDLRGKFLRGVDKDADGVESDPIIDPDRDDRSPNNPGGNTGNNVGTDQDDKTKAPTPTDNFVSENAGAHVHSVLLARGNSGGGGDGSLEPSGEWGTRDLPNATRGTHSHTITSGGDVETRPVNSSVVFIIKCRI